MTNLCFAAADFPEAALGYITRKREKETQCEPTEKGTQQSGTGD